jgi:type IV secretory pathway protease TraF
MSVSGMNIGVLMSLVAVNTLLASAPALKERLANPPAIINETISMRKGLYVRTGGTGTLRHSDIIAMLMNPSAQAYLGDRLGYPADTMLLKRVVALPGETVCRHDGRVTVPGREVLAKSSDSQGNALPTWVGCRTLKPTEVFVLGVHPASFDSRYFGPVPIHSLSGTYREVISW